jgi:hypothetical protein
VSRSHLRLLEDDSALPIVEVTTRDGRITRLAASTLDDEAARTLADTLRQGLSGVVVRVVYVPRVAIVLPIRA